MDRTDIADWFIAHRAATAPVEHGAPRCAPPCADLADWLVTHRAATARVEHAPRCAPPCADATIDLAGVIDLTDDSIAPEACDDEVVFVAVLPRATKRPARVVTQEKPSDVEVVGTTGENALEDYPHPREHCVLHAFNVSNAVRHCQNCYCFVCDFRAGSCPQWPRHCRATGKWKQWRDERALFKRDACAAAAANADPLVGADASAKRQRR
ncbi:hypothetical protein M885DRAFT_507415 [Pelagophyceae sp. CCMP2097]|nr:hypothetical protein M885DRAFT_507415 [Pelagophyceae sp. CCMP2097]